MQPNTVIQAEIKFDSERLYVWNRIPDLSGTNIHFVTNAVFGLENLYHPEVRKSPHVWYGLISSMGWQFYKICTMDKMLAE